MEYVLKFAMTASFALSVLTLLIKYIDGRKLCRSVRSISSSDNNIIKMLKKRYSDSVALGKSINNTAAFIKKNLIHSGVSDIAQKNAAIISSSLLAAFFVFLSLGYLLGIISSDMTVLYFIASASFYSVFKSIFSTDRLEEEFTVSMTDYLENTFKPRIYPDFASQYRHNRRQDSETAPYPSVPNDCGGKKSAGAAVTAADSASDSCAAAGISALSCQTAGDDELIEAILDEFLL